MTQQGNDHGRPDAQGSPGQGEQPPPLPRPASQGSGPPEIIPAYQPVPSPHGQTPRQAQNKLETYFGEIVRTGHFPLAQHTQLSAGCGTVKLDLREVIQPGETIELRLGAWMSTVKVAVPPGTEVDMQVNASLGDARLEVDSASQGARLTGARLVVSGWSTMSEVRVRAFALGAKPRSGWKWTRKR